MSSRLSARPVAVACAVVALVVAAVGLRRELTWYLAIDQYGYLTSARSLRAGQLTHDWPPARVLAERLPGEAEADILAHTYLWRGGRLYSRYAPGYPIVLATWTAIGGERAAPFLNPVLLLGLFALTAALAARLLGDAWAGTAALWVLLLLPTYIHLWGITAIRDPLAHLCGLGAFFLLLRRPATRPGWRLLAAGFLLGYTVSIRPDSGLYLLPAAAVALPLWRAARGLRIAVPLAFVVGMTPLFVHNTAATGNPLRPPQMIEAQKLLGAGPPPATLRLAAAEKSPGAPRQRPRTPPLRSGGGLRLQHLPDTLPQNLSLLARTLGTPLVVLAAVGLVQAAAQARPLIILTLLYGLPALAFYSLWGHADLRYLMGVHLVLILLATAGLCGSVRLLHGAGEALGRRWGTGREIWSTAAAVALAAALPGLLSRAPEHKVLGALTLGTILLLAVAALGVHEALSRRRRTALGGLGVAVMLCLAPLVLYGVLSLILGSPGRPAAMPLVHGLLVGAIAAAVLLSGTVWGDLPSRRVWLLAAFGLCTLGTWLALTNPRGRAPFQQGEVEAGQATVDTLLQPGSLVITTDQAGRPAENIDYYTAAHAIYLADLGRWRWGGCEAARRVLESGRPVYFLLPTGFPEDREIRSQCPAERVQLEVVAEARGRDAYRYFAASRFNPSLTVTLYRAGLAPPGPRA